MLVAAYQPIPPKGTSNTGSIRYLGYYVKLCNQTIRLTTCNCSECISDASSYIHEAWRMGSTDPAGTPQCQADHDGLSVWTTPKSGGA